MLAFPFLFTNCTKDKVPAPFTSKIDLELLPFWSDSFLCTAVKEIPGLGSVNWTANCAGYIHRPNEYNNNPESLSIQFTTASNAKGSFYEVRECLNISILPIKVGVFKVLSAPGVPNPDLIFSGSYSHSIADGCVLDALWLIDNTKTNFINITSIDTIAKRVNGSFDVHFKMKTQGKETLHSEVINFKSGSFRAKIYN